MEPVQALQLDIRQTGEAAAIKAEILRLVCLQATRSIVGLSAACIVVLLLIWGRVPWWREASWAVAFFGIAAARHMYAKRLIAKPPSPLERGLRGLAWSSLAGGASWGAVPIVFFGFVPPVTQAALTTILCGAAAGASHAVAVYPHAYRLHLVASLIPLTFFWVLNGTPEGYAFAVLIPLLAVILHYFVVDYARMMRESYRIRFANDRLVEQLRAEQEALARARDSAEQANASKTRFLAAASHDLRQPLYAMNLFLGSLAARIKEDEAAGLLRRVRYTADVLIEQFDSMLDLARFDAGAIQMEPRPFHLDRLTTELAEEFNPQAAEKGLGLNATYDRCVVLSDRVLVERVLRNLLSNAIRFTHSGSVSLICKREGSEARVAVVDTGQGIPENELERIFDEFVQLNSPARRRERGTGLGLAIVKRINAILRLDLSVKSALGVGTRFEFKLPLAGEAMERAALEGPSEPQIRRALRGLRIWVVEDDSVVREAIGEHLGLWGVEVSFAASAAELLALKARSGSLPDALLLDDMLGENESGFDIAQGLEGEMPLSRLIMITGNTDLQRLEAMRAKGLRVMLKPVVPERLMEALGAL